MWDCSIKNDKWKIDEEILQLYGLVKKATKKTYKSISNFEELECEKSLKINKYKLKWKLNNMDQVMGIVTLSKFIFQRKKLRNFDKKAKTWIVKTGDYDIKQKSWRIQIMFRNV